MNNKIIYLKCISDSGVYIISVKDIISMTSVISQDNEPYIRLTYNDSEMCVTNTIYCSKIEFD